MTAAGNQFWSQDSAGILDDGEVGDAFGAAIGWADFNGDGFDDVAVSAPDESLSKRSVGAVNVIYGSEAGLASNGNQFWTQDSPGILDQAETADRFGTSVVGHDFNGDGFGDLAVGIPGEGKPSGAGAVAILYGSAAGLTSSGNQILYQPKQHKGDGFGQALAAGDFDNDGFADLAVGADQVDVKHLSDAGAVTAFYGTAGGLAETGKQYWTQASPGVLDDPEPEEWLGQSLSAADFNGDSYLDLAIGVLWETVGAVDGAGATAVLYGSSDGLTATSNQLWSLDSAGVPGTAHPFDTNGDVVGGDFDGDGYVDLALGFQGAEVGSAESAGAVAVLYGTARGLTSSGSQLWSQDSCAVEDVAEADDRFGFALTSGDYNGDASSELAVGVYGESVLRAALDAGAVNVLYGTATGLSATGDQIWTQSSAGILDQAEDGDRFGSALAKR